MGRTIDLGCSILGATRVPALSADEVSAAATPLNAVLTPGLVGVSHVGSAVRPPGVVVAIVCAGGARSSRPLVVRVRGGASNDAGNGREGNDERGKDNHGGYGLEIGLEIGIFWAACTQPLPTVTLGYLYTFSPQRVGTRLGCINLRLWGYILTEITAWV